MTHFIYTTKILDGYCIAYLKTLYAQIGCTVEVGDKRKKLGWIRAIQAHQASQILEVQIQPAVRDLVELEVQIEPVEFTAGIEILPFTVGDCTVTFVETFPSGQHAHRCEKDGQFQGYLFQVPSKDDFATYMWSFNCKEFLTLTDAVAALITPQINTFYPTVTQMTKIELVDTLSNHQAIATSTDDLDPSTDDLNFEFKFELPEYEIDFFEDPVLCTVGRVWKSYQFAGSFYQNLDGEWVVQTLRGESSVLVTTAEEAYLTLVSLHESKFEEFDDLEASSDGLSPKFKFELDDLLDKPFDELTAAEWASLKAHTSIEEPQKAIAA